MSKIDVLLRVAEEFESIRAVRAPLLVAVAAGFFLVVPPQTREIYRALAEDLPGNLFQLVLSFILLSSASIALTLIARELLRELTVSRTSRLRKNLPPLCGGLVPGSLSIGLYLAALEAQIGTPPPEILEKMPELRFLVQALHTSRINLFVAGLTCVIITVSLVVPSFGFRSLSVRKFFARCHISIVHFAGLGVGCLLFFSIFSVTGSQLVGSLGIFLLAIIGIAPVAALLTRTGDRRRLPVLSAVVLVAVLLSLFDMTDNHGIGLTNTELPRLDRAVDVFKEWYESRGDREYYASLKRPYPVFAVAASGGGLYAAHHAATVLARLQDQCPKFPSTSSRLAALEARSSPA